MHVCVCVLCLTVLSSARSSRASNGSTRASAALLLEAATVRVSTEGTLMATWEEQAKQVTLEANLLYLSRRLLLSGLSLSLLYQLALNSV